MGYRKMRHPKMRQGRVSPEAELKSLAESELVQRAEDLRKRLRERGLLP